ncbi:hypothetical protein HJG60_007876 [Phyllostomus discolor]|uniref:Uncharacterized protein n=1 Tax=Phyllostomus discolor TaxID=89673 RepID=A0A834BIF9_9CHIR|nr:hypothetical protein HJG60_007876 [Phyllostomus discolor]
MSYLSILITIVLNFASDRLHIFILFSSFSGILFCSFTWAIFHCLLNLAASLCFCVCVLGRAALIPCLSSMAYCRKGTCKLCGIEPQVIARAGQLLHCFVVLWEGGLRAADSAAACLLEVCLVLTLYDGTPLAIALVLNPSGNGSNYILSLSRPFKQSLLKIQQFLSPLQHPLVFIARSYGDLSSWCWNPGLWGQSWELGLLPPKASPPYFYPPHMNVGQQVLQPLCITSRLCTPLPHCLSLDECGFFKSLVVGLPYSSISDGSGFICFEV